ncbi:MAG: 5'/3'-nucleotidase SurE [Actinomycetota bacterium]
MRILVTNDDGIDSLGLHELARAMTELAGDHEIVVAAPDREYSGAAASVGALHLIQPEVHVSSIDGLDVDAVWSVTGPPALCVFFARLGAFGDRFDLVVSGINPGANVGRAVYHSGTVGAALTARNGAVTGVAVSQAVSGFGVEGQGWDDALANQKWRTAAVVGRQVVQSVIDEPPSTALVINVNVPNLEVDEIKGWRHATVGMQPPRSMAKARLDPIVGKQGAFTVEMGWGDERDLAPETDGGAVERGHVAVTYLSRFDHVPEEEHSATTKALDALLD